jgi:NADH-quinone oxidoreductase subunit C
VSPEPDPQNKQPADDKPTPATGEQGDRGKSVPADGRPATGPGVDAPIVASSAAATEQENLPERLPSESAEVIEVRRGAFGVRGPGDTSGYGGLVRTVAMPGGSQRPYGGWFDAVADRLDAALAERQIGFLDAIEKVVVDRGEITFHIRRTHIAEVARTVRDDPHLRFELLSSLSGVHYPNDTGRELHVCYELFSLTHNRRIRLEVSCPDDDPHIATVTPTYPTADWHERETYDFFGVIFDGHPGLTRIEMPDDWPGFPQRKDYPLGGIPVEYKGATIPPPDDRRAYN